ncbi:MAG: bifunctional folylpolyglutamate synthase/dihydrofolate synthase [Pseudomonadota bacterium]
MTLDDWLADIQARHHRQWDLGLDRVGEVGRRLGVLSPAPHIFLIAGTNGKGSACEMISCLLAEKGLKVGKSTSPHLVRFNERIVIDGCAVSDETIIDAFSTIRQAAGDVSLSYFEYGALASMYIFRQAGVDAAVLEIGLGGRLDAMNIVDPDVSVITRIALDHQDWLGDTRELIAVEKAGVMRTGKPCVIADEDPPQALADCAARLGTPLRFINASLEFALSPDCPLPEPSLRAAIEAVLARGFVLSGEEVVAALGRLHLPGRFQILKSPRRTLLDVAHNPDAAAWLAQRLAKLHYRSCHAVFGIYADKDLDSVVACLAPLVDHWYLAAMPEPRAADTGLLEQSVIRLGGSVRGKYDMVLAAYDSASANAHDDDLILVFGSFGIVGPVLEHLGDGV